MRITRPRDWDYMSEEDRQAWAEKVGRDIELSKKIVTEKMKEMERTGVFDEKREEPPVVKSGMRWFPGGKF